MILSLILTAMTICPLLSATKLDEHIDLEAWCGGKPADIFFLLDASSSIYPPDFTKQTEFVQELVQVFDISETMTRVAVATFSTAYNQGISFGDVDDKENLKMAIGAIKHKGGNTNTGGAIKEMVEREFDPKSRRGVAHIAFILTDGQSQKARVTVKEAAKAKKKGIYMYAIGIGDSVDMTELRAIGSEPHEDFVHNVTTFSVLHTLKDTLAKTACDVESEKEQPQGDQAAACGSSGLTDIMFTFDSSAIGATKSQVIRTFIANISHDLVTDDGFIRTGVISEFCPDNDIPLNMYSNNKEHLDRGNEPEVHSYLDRENEPEVHSLDRIVKDLRFKSFKRKNGGRESAKNVAVLFIDNETEKIDRILQEIRYAKFQNIEFFIVNIGDRVNIPGDEFENHIWHIRSIDDLYSLKINILDIFC